MSSSAIGMSPMRLRLCRPLDVPCVDAVRSGVSTGESAGSPWESSRRLSVTSSGSVKQHLERFGHPFQGGGLGTITCRKFYERWLVAPTDGALRDLKTRDGIRLYVVHCST